MGTQLLRSHSQVRRTVSSIEVYYAVMAGKSNKSVGPDGVPQEMLNILVQSDEGLDKLTSLFEDFFSGRTSPEQWRDSLMTLLAKVNHPTKASELRPLMLTSHINKTYARIIVGRLSQYLQPSGADQCACAGRQTADVLATLVTVCQTSLEWGTPLSMLKF